MDDMSIFSASPALLHVDASPRRRSLSSAVGSAFADGWETAGGTVVHRRLVDQPVPHITEAWTGICDNLLADGTTALDRLHEGARTAEQRAAWAQVEPLLAEVVAADIIVLSTPMYNYSIPSALKAWIDQITFPRMNLEPRRFVVVAARGGTYQLGTPRAAVEHQVEYLTDFVQGHFAVPAPEVVVVELSNARVDPLLARHRELHDRSLASAHERAWSLGQSMVRELGVRA
jgi:FMN-dependent NADH-azoreductase